MNSIESWLPMLLLIALFVWTIKKYATTKDRTMMFCPLLFIILYLSYYTIVPFFFSDGDIYNRGNEKNVPYVLWGAVVNFAFILVGFDYPLKARFFRRLNRMYNQEFAFQLGVALFAIGFIAYAIINGFTFNVVAEQDETYIAGEHIFNHETTSCDLSL